TGIGLTAKRVGLQKGLRASGQGGSTALYPFDRSGCIGEHWLRRQTSAPAACDVRDTFSFMQAWALDTAVAFVEIAAVAMRWGGDLRRLDDAAIAALRALARRRGWLGMAV